MEDYPSKLFKLRGSQLDLIFQKYKSNENFFPIIGSAILGTQKGFVYADNVKKPEQVYVEHSFGFAQIFGNPITNFENNLKDYLLIKKIFKSPKVRLYGPYVPNFLKIKEHSSMVSFRQRFIIKKLKDGLEEEKLFGKNGHFYFSAINKVNFKEAEKLYGKLTRFWPTENDFINFSNSVVLYFKNQLIGICYSAGEANGQVEIDVYIQPRFRSKGLGKYLVSKFIKKCQKKSLNPLWDCFINNLESVKLSKKLGYSPHLESYAMYTIDR